MRRITMMLSGLASLALGMMLTFAPVSAAGQWPFAAYYTGSFQFPSPTTGTMQATGVASVSGTMSLVGTVNLTGPAKSCAGGFARSWQVTQTATTGDKLYMTVNDEMCFVTPTSTQDHGTYTITGGTGQFAGASGSGLSACQGDFTNNTFKLALVGKISS
jgi:hypothetical protein